MHELSIASSIVSLAREYVPAGAALLNVHIDAGPMRAIDPDAMEFAWRACVAGTEMEMSHLSINALPWKLRCISCGREFVSDDPFSSCVCGGTGRPVGGDELQITSIEVDEERV